eukprot:3796135-Prymnesium_polylepis.1
MRQLLPGSTATQRAEPALCSTPSDGPATGARLVAMGALRRFACLSCLAVACAQRRKLVLAHVENVSSPAVSGVLRWWCSTEGHASEPLCARHEISLRISVARGSERLELMQRKQHLLGQSVQRELQDAIDAYCNSSNWEGVGGGGARPVLCAEKGLQTVPPSKAEQLVQMNDYWCGQPGRNSTLVCRRHALQQHHQEAPSAAEPEGVTKALQELLTSATPEALADMREEARQMRQAYCALPSFVERELCDGLERTAAPARRALQRA